MTDSRRPLGRERPAEKRSADAGSWATSFTARRAMQANRSVDSQPELRLRSALHRLGLRFRRNYAIEVDGLRVRPDVVFPRRRVAVFLDGCYWHGCPQHGEQPRANADYWKAKIDRNRRRDRRVDAVLRGAGWTVFRVWEHEDPLGVAPQIRELVRARGE
jgi:DNA mismatch endonuclease, patch repair protein